MAVALVGAGAQPAAAFEPRVPETFFGISATELWDKTVRNQNAARDAQLNGMKSAGIDWVRVELGWPEIEPNAPQGSTHSYSWAAADRLVAALAARGMELMPVPMATPAWAASSAASQAGCGRRSGVATARTSDYAAFVEALIRRYGAGGSFWPTRPDLTPVAVSRVEIWNEPNWNGFWCPEPEPEVYATMLRAAADRIHAVDPGAQVIVGGFAALQDSRHEGETLRGVAVDEFLQRALLREPGLRTAIDAIAFHPYDLDPAMDLSMVGWLRRKMTEAGFGVDVGIVLTEFGWRGGLLADALSELLRTSNYELLTNQLPRTDCGITGVAAHTWQSAELDLLHPDHWWGIASSLTGLLYPSGRAYRDQIALFEGRGPTPAPRTTIEICGSPAPPDQDDDGVPDETDDYPTDPEESSGSGEVPPPPPEEVPVEPRPSTQRALDSFFGVSVVQLPDDFERLGDEYAAMSSARIGTVRQRIEWSWIEPVAPGDPTYSAKARWNWLDRIVLKMSAEGIGFVPAFGAVPAWAPTGGAAFDAQYVAFLERFARRYGRGGSFWAENGHLDEGLAVGSYEVWHLGNANQQAADGSASAAEYAATYAATRAALRSVDPDARAVASLAELGVGGDASRFLSDMVAARPGLGGTIDGVYVMADYSRTVTAIESRVRQVREALEATGNPVAPIYLGFGAPTAGPEAISEALRAQLFADVAGRAARGDCGVAGVFAHAWTTPESNPSNSWDWFGIADPDNAALRPTAESYRDVAASFGGFQAQAAPAAAVHPCFAQAPDRDGDGTPDAADPAPLDPAQSAPLAQAPPAPAIGGGPPSPTNATTASFTLSAIGASSYQCKLDDRPYEVCPAAVSYSSLSDGAHELRARAVDSLGLVGPEAVRRWTVDTKGPTVVEISGPVPVSLDTRVSFTFRADEADARFLCRLDGNPMNWCTSPRVFAFVGPGRHEFAARAVDALGNTGPVKIVAFDVVTTPGAAAISAGPGEGETSGPLPEFRFAAVAAASYECRLDAQQFASCSGAGAHTAGTALTEGPHTFEVRGVGGTGVLGAAASRAFNVDATGPALSIAQRRQKAGSRIAVFRIAATDQSGLGTLECRLDSGAWRGCGSRYRVRNPKPGRHRLLARIADAHGNPSQASLRWRARRR